MERWQEFEQECCEYLNQKYGNSHIGRNHSFANAGVFWTEVTYRTSIKIVDAFCLRRLEGKPPYRNCGGFLLAAA